MDFIYHNIGQFLLCSYATGWALIALRAKKKGIVDLCQFVRLFVFSPFVLTFWAGVLFVAFVLLREAIIPNILNILEGAAIIVGTCVVLGVAGVFGVAPIVKKAHGVAKPFSDKICIVLYRR